MAETAAQRQAKRRAKKHEAGLVKVELWVAPCHKEALAEYVFSIRNKSTCNPT